MYVARSVGGTLYLVGVFVMIYNLYKQLSQAGLSPTKKRRGNAAGTLYESKKAMNTGIAL